MERVDLLFELRPKGLGDLQGINEFFCLQRRAFRDLMKTASRAER